ncbi:MAG: TIGR04376 family protein [Pseudanabaenaceae cyanobacterium SKYGB_i_bin29]|nr:TIGR04376 family protein [Pseudanabaenaceae cyanobacterium SKYG29]MDW8421403.1 TIGR04376 family protein [Pseudanabaenaceae cyanobacterium SKYGB_i_bin29]
MGLIEDIKRFLELRLEDFIKQNPWLELQLLDDKLQQQEDEVAKLIATLTQQENQYQQKILALAEDVALWHKRAQKAREANRLDLATAAQEREAILLREGNQVWAQMELVKQRVSQAQDLLKQIKSRRQEVQAKIRDLEKQTDRSTWQSYRSSFSQSFDKESDPLEQEFRRWELEEELEALKRKMR